MSLKRSRVSQSPLFTENTGPLRLLSLDPGETTGASFITFDKSYVRVENVTQIKGGRTGFIEWVKWNTKKPIDHIVCEDFILRPGIHGANIEPAYVIGAMEALFSNREITLQDAGMKKLVGDDRLRKMEMFSNGLPHANDATRHGIIYLRNKKHMPTLLKGWE